MNKHTPITVAHRISALAMRVGSLESDDFLETDVRAKALTAEADALTQAIAEAADAKDAAKRAKDARNAAVAQASTKIVRVHSAVVGKYGPNSDEYATVGGTPTSKRKRGARKTKAAATQPAAQSAATAAAAPVQPAAAVAMPTVYMPVALAQAPSNGASNGSSNGAATH